MITLTFIELYDPKAYDDGRVDWRGRVYPEGSKPLPINMQKVRPTAVHACDPGSPLCPTKLLKLKESDLQPQCQF